MPRVSVIMPVYNNAQYVQQAIFSILVQTYTDFELIVIDDGSTDGSAFLISQINDARVRKVFHQHNKGIVESLNEGLRMATGEYVARMDSDDYSTPDRLATQVAFMDSHPFIELSGAAFTSDIGGRPQIKPAHHEEIKTWLLFHCCITHPTVIMRNSMIHRLGVQYDSNYPYAEDYELWNRLAPHIQMANIPVNLLFYRQHSGQVSQEKRAIQENSARNIRQRQLSMLGLQLSDEENQIMHQFMCFTVNPHDYANYSRALGFANWLLAQNMMYRVYNQEMLSYVLSRCISCNPY